MRLQQSTNGWSYSYVSWTNYDNLNSSSTITKSYTRSAIDGNNYSYRLVIWDYAWNINYISGPSSRLYFDTQAPSTPTISSSSHTSNVWSNNTSANFSITKNSAGPSSSTNYYCIDSSNSCNPTTSWNSKTYNWLSTQILYFRAKTCDTWGCSWVRSFILKTDTTNPSWSVAYSPSTWTNGNVIVKITCSDSNSGCNMSNISGWSKSGYIYSKTFTSNTSWNITIRDIAWNTRSIPYIVNNIDKNSPTTSANNSSTSLWRNTKVDITLSMWDNGWSWISYAKYKWDSNTCTTGTNFTNWQKIQVPSEWTHTLYLCTSDVAWNTQTWSGVYKYDATKPTVVDNYAYDNIWINTGRTITLTPNDPKGSDHSGISSTKYCWGASCLPVTWTTSTSITVTGQINNVIRYQSYDNAGNSSNIWVIYVKVDTTKPTTSANNSSTSLWRNTKVDITLSMWDNGWSWISYAKYKWDSNTCTTGTNFTNWQKIQVPSEWTHTLYLCTSDVAWNTQTWSGVYKYDATKPTVVDNYAFDNVWTNTGRTITLTPNDPKNTGINNVSGINTTKYCWGSTCDISTGTVGVSIVVTGQINNVLKYQTYDNATNASTIWLIYVKVDTTRPTLSANNSSTWIWRNSKVDITLSVWDAWWSWISYSRYRWDNNSCTTSGTSFTNGSKIQVPSEWTHTLYLCTSDVAWNTQTWSGVYKYDATKPTVVDNYAFDDKWTNTGRTITLTPNDPKWPDHSGLTSTKWCWWASCLPVIGTTATSISVNPYVDDTIRYQTYDAAWNSSDIWTIRVKIENSAPVTTLSFEKSDWGAYNETWWTNQDLTATIQCSDNDDITNSQCDSSTYEYRIQASNFTCNASGTWTSNTTFDILADEENKTRYVCSRVKDIAGNGFSYSPVYQINIDKVVPRFQDIISNSPEDRSKLMAVNSRNFEIEVDDNGGSPISLIEWYFENYNTIDSLENTKNSSDSDLNSTDTNILSVNKNISNVDSNRDSDGSRQYVFRITKVVDEAWNVFEDSTNWVKEFLYDVYANSNDIIATVPVNQLDINLTADATDAKLTFELKDIYGNQIIPASGIDRTVSFDFNVTNNLRLNQYTQTVNDDAITLDRPRARGSYTNRFSTSQIWFDNEPSVDGKYTYNFQVYAPTYDRNASNGRQWVNGEAFINTVDYIIEQSASTYIQPTKSGSIADATDIEFKFKPLFKAEFTWDVSKQISGNGAIQNSQLNVVKQSSISTPSGKIYLGFGQTNGTDNVEHPNYSFTYRPNSTNFKITEGHQSNINSLQDLWTSITSKNFDVKIELEEGPVDQSLATYVSSHIAYMLNGKTIVYDGHTVNKPRYVDGTSLANTRLVWLKVLGKIQSKNQQDITTDQSGTDLYAIGNNPKADLKEQIRKNVADITRNANKTPSWTVTNLSWNIWNNSQVGTRLMNDRVLYFWDINGWNINIWNSIDDLISSGIKTIIIEWWNAYIRSNISVNSTANDILGIIILEDENGVGWNLYIDPSVTEISATIYADKSLISYNGSEEIWSGAATSQLKNQLYIFGTLFTENTIWGSVNPYRCPYYIDESNCDFNTAKKFDLNFTRRYFIQENGNPYDWGQSYYPDSSAYYEYPMIIEYNPNIQNTPPPLFNISEEN